MLFCAVYGLTEVTGPCTTASKNPREYVSAGMPVAMMHVKVHLMAFMTLLLSDARR